MHPDDGPEDEMEKWSPDQWTRFFAASARRTEMLKHVDRLESDLEKFRQAGLSVVATDRGAEIDGRMLISNRKRCWKLIGHANWYGYADPQKLIHFLATGEWVRSEGSKKRSAALASERVTQVVIPAIPDTGDWTVDDDGKISDRQEIYMGRLAIKFTAANSRLLESRDGTDAVIQQAVETAAVRLAEDGRWTREQIEEKIRRNVLGFSKALQRGTVNPIRPLEPGNQQRSGRGVPNYEPDIGLIGAAVENVNRIVPAQERDLEIMRRRLQREQNKIAADKAALYSEPTYTDKGYAAAPDTLAELGFRDVTEFVKRFNEILREKGRFPISQGDFPSSKSKFERLVKKWRVFCHG